MIVTDIGEAQVEEINLGLRDANYGWLHREGMFVTERSNEAILYPLPVDDSRFGCIYLVAQHDLYHGRLHLSRAAIPGLVGEISVLTKQKGTMRELGRVTA